jgi:hypothetical protein
MGCGLDGQDSIPGRVNVLFQETEVASVVPDYERAELYHHAQ